MAKNKVSDWDVVSDNNLDIKGINISDNMPPSFVNDAMREMMAQIKQWQVGAYDENITIKGDLDIQGGMTLDGNAGTSGQLLMSQGEGTTPQWGTVTIPDAFSTGMIVLWSGTTNTIPSGWALCNGANGTPNLTDRFIVGAGNTYGVNQTGGYADATLVSHNHSASTGGAGGHSHSYSKAGGGVTAGTGGIVPLSALSSLSSANTGSVGNHTHSVTVNSKGSSATNKNLPPYYALAYIMRL